MVSVDYGADQKLGRPKEKVSNINTQNNAFGKDRLGKKGMKNDYNAPKQSRTKSPTIALETMLSQIPISKKQLVFEQDIDKESLLDENNIKKPIS